MLDRSSIQVRVSNKEEAEYFEKKLRESGEVIAHDYWPFADLLVYGFESWYLSSIEWDLEEISFDQLLKRL